MSARIIFIIDTIFGGPRLAEYLPGVTPFLSPDSLAAGLGGGLEGRREERRKEGRGQGSPSVCFLSLRTSQSHSSPFPSLQALTHKSPIHQKSVPGPLAAMLPG